MHSSSTFWTHSIACTIVLAILLKTGQVFVAKAYAVAIGNRQIALFGAALIGLLSGVGVTQNYLAAALIVVPVVTGFFLIVVLKIKRPDLWRR